MQTSLVFLFTFNYLFFSLLISMYLARGLVKFISPRNYYYYYDHYHHHHHRQDHHYHHYQHHHQHHYHHNHHLLPA